MYKDSILFDRREMLRVKIKSLAEEARIIRREERRTWGQLRNELHDHRVQVVRKASRSAHVAYAILLGRTLEQIEGNAKKPFNLDAVRTLLKKYGPPGAEKALVA